MISHLFQEVREKDRVGFHAWDKRDDECEIEGKTVSSRSVHSSGRGERERGRGLTNGFDQESFSISREHFDDFEFFFFEEGRVGCRSYSS